MTTTTATQTFELIENVELCIAEGDFSAAFAPLALLVDRVLCEDVDTDELMERYNQITFEHHDDLILIEEVLEMVVRAFVSTRKAPGSTMESRWAEQSFSNGQADCDALVNDPAYRIGSPLRKSVWMAVLDIDSAEAGSSSWQRAAADGKAWYLQGFASGVAA